MQKPSLTMQAVCAARAANNHVLGIDPKLTFPDHSGRPIYLLDEGKAIKEII